MDGLRKWVAGLLVLVAAGVAPAQLKDDQFKVPAKPGDFSDKTIFTAFPAPAAPAATAPAPAPGATAVKPPPPLWTGSLEMGLSGSDGNTDVLKLRVGGLAKRQTDSNIFTADLLYGLVQTQGKTTENKALFNVRDECLFKDSPWAVFLSGQLEYDEFRAYDYRIASHTGVAYQVVKNEATNLRTRLGAGFSREVGGPSGRWIPEGLAGFDLYQKVTDRQQFVGSVDFYPDLGRWGRYRVRARAAYEFLLEPEWGLILRFGIQDRYDSDPGPKAMRNDIDYFATMLFKF